MSSSANELLYKKYVGTIQRWLHLDDAAPPKIGGFTKIVKVRVGADGVTFLCEDVHTAEPHLSSRQDGPPTVMLNHVLKQTQEKLERQLRALAAKGHAGSLENCLAQHLQDLKRLVLESVLPLLQRPAGLPKADEAELSVRVGMIGTPLLDVRKSIMTSVQAAHVQTFGTPCTDCMAHPVTLKSFDASLAAAWAATVERVVAATAATSGSAEARAKETHNLTESLRQRVLLSLDAFDALTFSWQDVALISLLRQRRSLMTDPAHAEDMLTNGLEAPLVRGSSMKEALYDLAKTITSEYEKQRAAADGAKRTRMPCSVAEMQSRADEIAKKTVDSLAQLLKAGVHGAEDVLEAAVLEFAQTAGTLLLGSLDAYSKEVVSPLQQKTDAAEKAHGEARAKLATLQARFACRTSLLRTPHLSPRHAAPLSSACRTSLLHMRPALLRISHRSPPHAAPRRDSSGTPPAPHAARRRKQ